MTAVLSVVMLDRLLTRALAPSEIWTRYAQWLQARGFAETSLGHILIECGQCTVDDVKRALEPWVAELEPDDITRATGIAEEPPSSFLAPPMDAERFANALLLHATRRPGGTVRVESDRVLVRNADSFEEDARFAVPADRAREMCAAMHERLKMMAQLDPARPPPQAGTIILQVVKGLRYLLSVEWKRTDRGECALVRRVLPWCGKQMPENGAFEPWREIMNRAERSQSAGEMAKAESALREAVTLAHSMGVDATLEEIHACRELVDLLVHHAREIDARPFAERAHALATSHVPNPLARALFAFTLASTRVDAPDVRAEGAAAALPSIHDEPIFRQGRAAAFARDAGRPEQAARLAEDAERDVRNWYGGLTADVLDAWTEAAQADVDLGHPERAHERAHRIRDLGGAVQHAAADALAFWVEGRAYDCSGDHDAAIQRLTTARDLLEALTNNGNAPMKAEIEADLALALFHAGRSQAAHHLASDLRARAPLTLCARISLQQIHLRAGPFC